MKKKYLTPASNAIRFEMGSNILNNISPRLTFENTKSAPTLEPESMV